MDEHGRFGNNGDTSAFEENAELLIRGTAEEILSQSQSGYVNNTKPDPAKSRSASGSKAAASGKGKKPGKPSAKEAEKPSAADNKGKNRSEAAAPVKRPKKSGSKPAAADETADKKRVRKSVSERLASELADVKPPSPKKRTAKKSAQTEEEPSAEQPLDDGANRPSCKTPQVMKLIEDDSDELVIYAGKSQVPKLLRGRESLSRLTRKSAAENETEVVNITELVIRHEAADILDRFNACSCEKCVRIFSELISQRIPVRYARISRSELESGELPERAVPMRKVVLPEMIRELICNKKRSFHDK